jgi:hypothetical protein
MQDEEGFFCKPPNSIFIIYIRLQGRTRWSSLQIAGQQFYVCLQEGQGVGVVTLLYNLKHSFSKHLQLVSKQLSAHSSVPIYTQLLTDAHIWRPF